MDTAGVLDNGFDGVTVPGNVSEADGASDTISFMEATEGSRDNNTRAFVVGVPVEIVLTDAFCVSWAGVVVNFVGTVLVVVATVVLIEATLVPRSRVLEADNGGTEVVAVDDGVLLFVTAFGGVEGAAFVTAVDGRRESVVLVTTGEAVVTALERDFVTGAGVFSGEEVIEGATTGNVSAATVDGPLTFNTTKSPVLYRKYKKVIDSMVRE